MRHPDARARRCSNSADLPTPGSPRTTSTRLWPARTPSSKRSSVSHSLRRPRRRGRGSPLDMAAAERTGGLAAWQLSRPARAGRAAGVTLRSGRIAEGRAAEWASIAPVALFLPGVTAQVVPALRLRLVEQHVDRHATEVRAELRPLGDAVDVAGDLLDRQGAELLHAPRAFAADPCPRCGMSTRRARSAASGCS